MRRGSIACLVLLIGLSGCEEKRRAKESALRSPKPPSAKAGDAPVGRWKGDAVCIELYPSGEFVLSDLREGPKVVITGDIEHAPKGELRLVARRIERMRWISSCRKRVTSAALLERHDLLGIEIALDKPFTMRLRKVSANAIELCGERCDTLTRAAPRLAGRWRDPASETSRRATASWQPGALLMLQTRPNSTSIWVGGDPGTYYTVYGQGAVKALPVFGRFEVMIEPRMILQGIAKPDPEISIRALGLEIAVGKQAVFQVERVKGGVKVCGAGDRCVSLPAQHTLRSIRRRR